MSLWFLLWFVLSFILLGATFWSTIILIQQKKAWREFAAKKGLTFTPNKFFEPASLEGVIDGYNISFFSAIQQKPDARRNRQLTVMQVNANESFVDGIVCGTSEMLPFMQSLEGLTPHDVKAGKWSKKNHIRSRNKKAVDVYLTEERVATLNSILSMPNADILVLLDDTEGVFRFETPNPLQNAAQIESVVQKLLVRIKKLEPTQEETQKFSSMVEDKAIETDSLTSEAPAVEEAASKTPPNTNSEKNKED